jgi:hypothetical protein
MVLSLVCYGHIVMIMQLVRVLYPGYRGSPVMTQNSGYDRFPPAANDWETIHPVSDMAPPLQAEEEGPPT